MLELLFGGHVAEKVLLYLQVYEEGYAREIARTYEVSVSHVNKQLVKFADAGLLTQRLAGRTRIYAWNTRNPLVDSLRNFLNDIVAALPSSERERFYRQRKRPRAANKPILPA